MNAFGKFLLDYYIWILAVLGIVVITIIGFLVDSKQKRKKKELGEQKIVNVDKIEGSIMVNSLENVPITDTTNQVVPAVIDNEIGNSSLNNYNLDTNNQTMVQNSESLSLQDNSVSNVADVSLNAQKPHFEPRQVNVPNLQQTANSDSYAQIAVPQQVNAVPLTQTVQQPIYTQVSNSNFVNQTPYTNGIVNNQQFVQNEVSSNITNVKPIYPGVVNNQVQDMTQPGYSNGMPNSLGNAQSISLNTQNSSLQSQSIDNAMNFIVGEPIVNNSDDIWKL